MTRKELIKNIKQRRSFLCVGLDTDLAKIPDHLLGSTDPMFEFNKAIIDATAPYCVAYKPNTAFYECQGIQGWQTLEKTVGDIGNTSKMYAATFFEQMNVDAVTVAPYMGQDSVTPFLEYTGKWVVLLDLTSNKGSHDFQFFTDSDGMPLWERVLRVSAEWAGDDQMMYVVGATQGSMFQEIRRVAPTSLDRKSVV